MNVKLLQHMDNMARPNLGLKPPALQRKLLSHLSM